ncbi:MAG: hypothetical protein IH591_20015, partial [Bacteroidales bacterium]|nr:hypothetical protein [Bacteroidales bacterium]
GISFASFNCEGESGKIMIFLPGIGTFKENYYSHALSFSQYYSKIYLLDLPEQGSKGNWQIGVMSDQLSEFIKAVDNESVEKIDLFGHSAGSLAVLSFLVNFNSRIENIILSEVGANNGVLNFQSIERELLEMGFGTHTEEMRKISKVVLYAPPDSFNTVIKRKRLIFLGNRNRTYVKRLLNIMVNGPMLFLRFFSAIKYFRFRLDKSGKPQYFNLVVNNHVSFFSYIIRNRTIFEIFDAGSPELRRVIQNAFTGRDILIQYGSIDWLLKPWLQKITEFENNRRMTKQIVLVRHKLFGHMLNKRLRPDINMNLQMITSKKVIDVSKSYILNKKIEE